MRVTVEDVNPVKKKMDVSVPKEEVARELSNYFDDLRKKVKVRGFRPGKVPMSMIRRLYKEAAEEDVAAKLISESYPKAIEEQNIRPLGSPALEKGVLTDSEDFTYSATVEVPPEIHIEGYLGVELEKAEPEVTDAQVDERVERLREVHAHLNPVEDRPVQDGDVAVVNYQRFLDGEPLEDSKHEQVHMEIGKGRFPELEKGLTGLSKGEDKEVEVTYPEDAQMEDLRGKTVKFRLEVTDIKEKELPEPDDDFAKDLNLGIETMEELRDKIRSEILEEEERRVQADLNKQILDKFLKENPFAVPETLVEYETESMLENLEKRIARQGMTLEAMNMDREELRKTHRIAAEERVRASLLLNEIAKKEKVEVDEVDLNEAFEKMARQVGQDREFIRSYYEKGGLMDGLRGQLLEEKTLKLICDHATMKPKSAISQENSTEGQEE